jgi:spermidine/putrescine transport system substrate-binding protein
MVLTALNGGSKPEEGTVAERRDRYTRINRMSRRDFLRRSAGAALAVPSMAAILAACSKPAPTGGDGSPLPSSIPIATQDNPVTLPLRGQPVATDAPIEEGTLQIYNWIDYMWKRVIDDWGLQAKRDWEYTSFNTMAEAQSKLAAGRVKPDVFFPTIDILAKSVYAGLLQPLNHELIPNISDTWEQFGGTDSPWYDQGWRYTVPYTVYTTGIAYRKDHISEDEVAEKGYEIFWDPQYKGKVGIYDDYREALGMAMMRRGVTDINTGDPKIIDQAKNDLIDLIDTVGIRTTINGAYSKLPDDEFWIHQSWSGDIIGAQWYLPKGVSTDVLGFYQDEIFPIGNDLMAIPSVAEHPAMAHDFMNYYISSKPATKNFSWNGYQPPLNSMDPETLVEDGYVPESVGNAVVASEDFENGLWATALPPEVDDMWQSAWDEFRAGG